MTPATPVFLLIDDNRDRRSLLVRTIRRKFPSAEVHECAESGAALACVRAGKPDAVVLHRAADAEGVALLGVIRNEDPSVPVAYLAVGDQTRQAVEASGRMTRFLNYGAWLNIGTVLEAMLRATVE